MIIVLLLPFLIAGLAIAWIWGIKPSIENTKTIKDHYEKSNRKG